MTTYNVTCHTEGCRNEGVVIEIEKDPDGDVVCGPCAQPMTDVVEA